MTGGERSIRIPTLQATQELPVIRVEAGAVGRRMNKGPRSAEGVLQYTGEYAADDDRFRSMQPEIRHVALLRSATDDVQRSTDDDRARLGDGPDCRGDSLQESVRLRVLVLQSRREVLVDGTK